MAVGPTARILRLALPIATASIAGAVVLTLVTGSGPKTVALLPVATPSAAATVSPPAAPTHRPAATSAPRPVAAPRYRVVNASYDVPVGLARRGAHTALILGIDDTDPKNPLIGGRADATNLRDALLKYGFRSSDITVLIDGQATRPRILAELRRLVARTPADGLAVFAASSHGAGSSFRTHEGARLYASELAGYLRQIRAPVWSALAMCYAGGFSVPGIVGPNRIATFSSDAKSLTYEIGAAGSELFYFMVGQGMLAGYAPRSVESAFNYARSTLAVDHSNLPVMNDGVPGDLVLGPANWSPPVTTVAEPPPPPVDVTPVDPTPDPTPPPDNGGLGGILCGLLGCRR